MIITSAVDISIQAVSPLFIRCAPPRGTRPAAARPQRIGGASPGGGARSDREHGRIDRPASSPGGTRKGCDPVTVKTRRLGACPCSCVLGTHLPAVYPFGRWFGHGSRTSFQAEGMNEMLKNLAAAVVVASSIILGSAQTVAASTLA